MSAANDLLDQLHEKLLIGWIVNDGKPHNMPSHSSNDGCTDETAEKLLQLLRDKLPKKSETWTTWITRADDDIERAAGMSMGYNQAIDDVEAMLKEVFE